MTLDVPVEVHAALLAASAATPDDPAGPTARERAEWWERHAQAEEVSAQAYGRLHEWAIATGQPAAVTWAIAAAVLHHEHTAKDCLRDAARAREETS